MASLSEIRAAIKTTLEDNLPGVSVYAETPPQVNVPAVMVQLVSADYDQAMGRGNDTWPMNLIVLVAKSDEKLAQLKIDPYVDGGGSSSIRKVIFDNKTLGLTNVNAHVATMTGYGGQWDVGGYTYVGAALQLIVHYKPD
jgi:hypothetical protein